MEKIWTVWSEIGLSIEHLEESGTFGGFSGQTPIWSDPRLIMPLKKVHATYDLWDCFVLQAAREKRFQTQSFLGRG